MEISLAEPLVDLAKYLETSENADHALSILREADAKLDDRERSRREREDGRTIVLSAGLEVRLPESFYQG
jgi:hypothetical protein